ncbi:MAG TPA: ATP-binding protein [Anaerolineae bacterium]|nr:ATP-binding protein [Anaerolineae bacterium]
MQNEIADLTRLPVYPANEWPLATALTTPELPGIEQAEEPSALIFENIQRAKQEWEATADSLPELICVLDDQGRIIRTNRTIETWQLGYVKSVQGAGLHSILHPPCSDPHCALDRALRKAQDLASVGQSDQFETFDLFLQRYLLVRMQPIITQRPNLPATAVIVIEDITERRHNEEALRRSVVRLATMNEIQRSILAARSPEEIARAALTHIRSLVPFRQARVTLCNIDGDEFVVLIADANGATHLRPSRLCTMADLPVDEVRCLTQVMVVDDLTQPGTRSAIEQQLIGDGMRSWINVPLVSEEQFIGSLLLASDHAAAFESDYVAATHEIGALLSIAMNQARLHRQLQQTNDQLRRALHAKEEMIQNVSHELRTPVAIISGYTDLMEAGDLGGITTDQKRVLGIMLKQEERLQFMVDRLIDLRTANVPVQRRDLVDIAEWLPLIVRPWQVRASLHAHIIGVEVNLPTPHPALTVDAAALKQVLDNLLDNAIKFSSDGSLIQIRVKVDRGAVIVAVQDQGIGILANQLERVFEQFHQLDGSATRRYGGMGIGLALCRELVEAHGGCMWAESAGEGQGSTFRVALPLDGDTRGDDQSPDLASHETEQDVSSNNCPTGAEQ